MQRQTRPVKQTQKSVEPEESDVVNTGTKETVMHVTWEDFCTKTAVIKEAIASGTKVILHLSNVRCVQHYEPSQDVIPKGSSLKGPVIEISVDEKMKQLGEKLDNWSRQLVSGQQAVFYYPVMRKRPAQVWIDETYIVVKGKDRLKPFFGSYAGKNVDVTCTVNLWSMNSTRTLENGDTTPIVNCGWYFRLEKIIDCDQM